MATTISIKEETRNHLRQLGIKGDTYDKIINKLLDVYHRDGEER